MKKERRSIKGDTFLWTQLSSNIYKHIPVNHHPKLHMMINETVQMNMKQHYTDGNNRKYTYTSCKKISQKLKINDFTFHDCPERHLS